MTLLSVENSSRRISEGRPGERQGEKGKQGEKRKERNRQQKEGTACRGRSGNGRRRTDSTEGYSVNRIKLAN